MKIIFTLLSFLALFSLSCSEKKKTIYLIRNGETNFNTDSLSRVGGRINVPLNDLGIARCKAAGDFLSNQNIVKYIIVHFQELNNLQNILQNNIKLKLKW